MNNLCKITFVTFLSLLVSCSRHTPEPLFEDVYVYKNLLSNNISIDFYRHNAEKVTVNIIDSISINSNRNQFNYNFSPGANDSIVIKFCNDKKIIFRAGDTNSSNWNLNAINSSIYKLTQEIKGNLTTSFYTYAIDNKIYELAK